MRNFKFTYLLFALIIVLPVMLIAVFMIVPLTNFANNNDNNLNNNLKLSISQVCYAVKKDGYYYSEYNKTIYQLYSNVINEGILKIGLQVSDNDNEFRLYFQYKKSNTVRASIIDFYYLNNNNNILAKNVEGFYFICSENSFNDTICSTLDRLDGAYYAINKNYSTNSSISFSSLWDGLFNKEQEENNCRLFLNIALRELSSYMASNGNNIINLGFINF